MSHEPKHSAGRPLELHGWYPRIGDATTDAAPGVRFEHMGTATVWVPEAGHDPFLAAAELARGTETLRIGTGVAVAYARTPFATAQAGWDLQRATGGRFILGLGTQVRAHVERRYGTSWPGGAAAIKEYVECCRAIWACWQDGEQPAFEGRHYRFTMSNPSFEPPPLPAEHAHVPVWLGTVGPRLAEVVGEVADGLYAHAFHTPAYLRDVLLPAVAEGARRAGRPPPTEVACPVFGGIAFDDRQAAELREAFRARLAFYGSTPTYAAVLDHAGFAELHPQLRGLSRQRRWTEMASLIPDEMLDVFTVCDEPIQLGKRLARRYDGLLSGLSLYPGADRFASADDLRELGRALRS